MCDPGIRVAVLAAVLAAGCAMPSHTSPAATRRAPFDIIVRGGSVLDGTGRPAVRADVGISGSHIVSVGDLSHDSATTTIDAIGLIVAPGFINIHSHAVPSALATAANMLQQGVTTEVMNADGGGPLDIAADLAALDSGRLAINIGVYAPFNSAWASVVGNTDRRPAHEQLALITALLERGLMAGAWGVSAGLDYKPAYYATTDEVIAALAPLRAWRTNFPNHDRLTPENGFSSMAAMRETIEIGERAGMVPVITHMKLQGKEQGRADSALMMMQAATARGAYTAADVYPYLAGQTSLAALFIPGWAQEGGRNALLQRLHDAPTRARIARETEDGLLARMRTPANVYVIGRNKTVAALMVEMGDVSAGEAIARVLEVESPSMIATFGAEPDLVKILDYPDAAIACDCGASLTASHPRYFGTFPRVLGHYARDVHALSLTTAVRKMTALPAATVGMVDRGMIASGMAADLAIFDPATIGDHATYEQPMALSDGVRFVIVNGQVALREGRLTGSAAGRTLRRTRSMVSRPLNVASTSMLKVEASGSGRHVSVDLAHRRIHVDGAGAPLDATEIGLVQTAPRWLTLTGTLRDTGAGALAAFVLIVDEETSTLTLQVDGRPTLVAAIAR